MLFTDFFYTMKEYGVPITTQYILEFREAVEKGLASNLEELYLLLRLICVKRIEHMDSFERAFAKYFYNLELPAPEDTTNLGKLLENKPFQDWLNRELKKGNLTWEDIHYRMPPDELFKRFIETVMKQMDAHHGGDKWIGTNGSSPFGHSGTSPYGIRVYGDSAYQSAIKMIGERRYADYSSKAELRAENVRQVLGTLKNMVPAGPVTELDLDETIYRTARNGGEIEMVFTGELRDKIKVALLMDNGGYSMDPYMRLIKLVFSKTADRFKELSTYYFHNCIYGTVFTDAARSKPYPMEKFLTHNAETRVIIIGDASMAPEELMMPNGAIDYGVDDGEPGRVWLERMRDRFRYCVWLNPKLKEDWYMTHGSHTIDIIGRIIHMEDLTLEGIKNAVEYLNAQKQAV